MSDDMPRPRIFITGTAGFIGFHLAKHLLDTGAYVRGYDGLTDYYDVALKQARHDILLQAPRFSTTIGLLEDAQVFEKSVTEFKPDIIIHLAAQAGVRYSLENPRVYIDGNIVGTFNVLEAAKKQGISHLLLGSTSSIYGANEKIPFQETDRTDAPLTVYAATKKSGELLAHSYAHLWNIPTTIFRFFTVYGPWGRPDMAYFKFTKSILEGRAIDIYNNGNMSRDFTYIDDLVRAVCKLIENVPERGAPVSTQDTLSPVAPHRIVNIGRSEPMQLLDFISALEDALGIKAKRNYMDMQMGDVPTTWANADLLKTLTGFQPRIAPAQGIAEFVAWYREHYKV